MLKNDVIKYIITLLERKKPIEKNFPIEKLKYMETGYIDSLGFMKFIIEIEEKYQIEFSEDEIIEEKFASVGGLAEIILQKYQKVS